MQNFNELRTGLFSKVQNIFLIIAIPFGLLFVFLTPPMQAPDEHHHFFRAYQVSTLNIVPDILTVPVPGVGGDLPDSIKQAGYKLLGEIPSHPENKASQQLIDHFQNEPIKPKVISLTHFEPASSSSPVPYLPQALGIWLAQIMGGTVLTIFYFGRLVNFAIWLALAWAAIRIIPFGKWAYLVLLLTPVSLFQASSMSPDAVTNGLAFLVVATTLRIATNREPVRLYQIGPLLLTCVLLAFCKQAYFMIALLPLVISPSKFGSRKQWFGFAALVGLCAILPTVIWASIAQHFLPLLNANFLPNAHMDAAEQIKLIIGQPFHFLKTLTRTFGTHFSDYIVFEFNSRLGWSDVILPAWLMVADYGLILVTMLGSSLVGLVWQRWQRIATATILGLTFAGLSVILYLSWTPVGDTVVRGLQGRYLIPLSALCAPIFVTKKAKLNFFGNGLSKLVTIAVPSILTIAVFTLVSRYYGA